jgi:hypothetical protein
MDGGAEGAMTASDHSDAPPAFRLQLFSYICEKIRENENDPRFL